jgi:hypothetical protein
MNPQAQQPPGTYTGKQNLPIGQHPILPKQESATGHPMNPFGEELVIVYNPGPIQPKLVHGGVPYSYPENSSTTVPATVAWFHFGVLARDGKLERHKGPGSYAEDRFSSYCPLFLWQTDLPKYEEFKDWFYNKLKFKCYRPKVRVSSKEFEDIPGEAIS